MLKQLTLWFKENNTPITWWIIGWLSFGCVDQLIKGYYIMAFVDAGLAYINYRMWKEHSDVQ